MAGSFVQLDISIDEQLKDVTRELLALGHSLAPVQSEIGEHLLETHQARYKEEVDPQGHAWAELADSTIAGKGNNRILQDRGTLRDTYRYQISGNQLFFGTDLIYAATHQFGREDDGIVQREHLGLSPEDPAAILEMLKSRIASSI